MKEKPETLSQKSKRDRNVMKILKTTEARHKIMGTDKGDLWLLLPLDGQAKDYRFILDAVPLDKKANEQLLKEYDGVYYTL